MKTYYLIVTVLLLVLGACKKTTPVEPEVEVTPEQPEVEVVEPEVGREIPDTELGFLVTYEGKYATREKLFENEVLAARLKQLERFNYDSLLAFYNTETPLVIIDNIVHMSGCKQHDCPSNAYDFFIDVENDNINVYHFRSNMLKIYQEKGWIELPPAFAEEMEIKKSNARIGEIDDTESTYSLTIEQ